jgi:hypothetical protein
MHPHPVPEEAGTTKLRPSFLAFAASGQRREAAKFSNKTAKLALLQDDSVLHPKAQNPGGISIASIVSEWLCAFSLIWLPHHRDVFATGTLGAANSWKNVDGLFLPIVVNEGL